MKLDGASKPYISHTGFHITLAIAQIFPERYNWLIICLQEIH
jgi:hypothetical protein